MAILLAKKSGPQDNAVATDDQHHETLASDPNVPQFPQTNSFASTGSSFGAIPPVTNSFGSQPLGNGSNLGAASPTPAATSNFGGTQMPQQNQAELLKSGGGAMSQGGESTVALDKDATDWINKKWRPVMGWVYMMTCTADFVLFPVLWSLLQAVTKGNVTMQWQPLTLQGAGLYHIAMGAVLGIAAYGRTKEKIEGAAK